MEQMPNLPARPALPTEADTRVSQREFEQRMFALQQQIHDQIHAQRELLEERSKSLDKALQLQAEEYKRRLAELNHAHELAQENWAQSLPRELFDSHKQEWQHWKDAVNTNITTLTLMPTSLSNVEARLKAVEIALQQAVGALTLIRFMGFAGVVALIVTFARMAKWMP